MNGFLIGGKVILDDKGKTIVETARPETPQGYVAEYMWEEYGSRIVQIWNLVPVEGTAQEAALKLSMLQARSLPDEAALEFVALYPEWIVGEAYAVGDRVKRLGTLYKCLTGHVSQADWTPESAPSLWARVLPGQEGNEPEDGYAEWVQPDSTNGYSVGDRVLHGGHLWTSLVDDNVDEPGTDNGVRWKDEGEMPEPSGEAE